MMNIIVSTNGSGMVIMVWISNVPYNSCIEGLVPSPAMFRDGYFFLSWLDYQGANFSNELTRQWIQNWMNYWEVVETFGGGT